MGPKQHLGRWADDIPRLDNSKQDKESGLTTGNPEFLGKYHMDDLCVCRSQALGKLTYMHFGKAADNTGLRHHMLHTWKGSEKALSRLN